MPRLHINRHGHVTPYLHIHRRHRHLHVPTLAVARVHAPRVAVAQPWHCGHAIVMAAASFAALTGVVLAILGIALLSPAMIGVGAAVAICSVASMPLYSSRRVRLIP